MRLIIARSWVRAPAGPLSRKKEVAMLRTAAGMALAIALVSCGGGKAAPNSAQADTTAFADSVAKCQAAVSAATEPSLDTATGTQDQERCAALLSRDVIKKYYPGAK